MSNGHATSDTDLPWLQEVEDEDGPRGVSAGKMLAVLAVILLGAAIIAGTFFWLGRTDPADSGGVPELIRAPQGPYKMKPADPGGLDVAGESETAFETSAGQDVDSQLDTSRLPQPPAAQAEPKPVPPGSASEPVAPAPAPSPSGASGSVIQLGAFRNTAQAERAWGALTARFPNLSNLSKIVVPYSAGASRGYRLRAGASSPAEAQQMCSALEAGGESCFIAR